MLLLAERGLERDILAGVSSFLAPPMIMKQSQFILTCLQTIAEQTAALYCDLKIYPCPLPMKPVTLTTGMAWSNPCGPITTMGPQSDPEIFSRLKKGTSLTLTDL